MNSWIISGIILVIGAFICLILILRSKWSQTTKNINDYKVRRDSLTFRKKYFNVSALTDKLPNFHISLGSMIGGFVSIIVGASLLPEIANQVSMASANVTSGVADTLIQLVPVMFSLAVALAGIGIVLNSMRSSGIL